MSWLIRSGPSSSTRIRSITLLAWWQRNTAKTLSDTANTTMIADHNM
jgi:hypothetical protein